MSTVKEKIKELVAANRILAHYDVLDGYGHVSVRYGKNRFFLARNLSPALVTADDILEFDLDGELVGDAKPKIYLERFIHSEIYRAHKTVQAVVHTHSPAVIPFGVTDAPLLPVYHMAAFLGGGAPVFDLRDEWQDGSDLLITNADLGAKLAAHVARAKPVVLMRGHGNVVVAESLRMAVFRAVYTEQNAKIYAAALALGHGKVRCLSRGEAEAATKTSFAVVDRTWEYWRRTATSEPQ